MKFWLGLILVVLLAQSVQFADAGDDRKTLRIQQVYVLFEGESPVGVRILGENFDYKGQPEVWIDGLADPLLTPLIPQNRFRTLKPIIG